MSTGLLLSLLVFLIVAGVILAVVLRGVRQGRIRRNPAGGRRTRLGEPDR